jgi:hypothetical protein
MSFQFNRPWLPLSLLLMLACLPPAFAVTSGQDGMPPNAAALSPLSLKYCSVFAQYRRFGEQAVESWQKTNATVQQAGGWRALAKEARQTDPAQPDQGKPLDPDCPSGMEALSHPAAATNDAGAKP